MEICVWIMFALSRVLTFTLYLASAAVTLIYFSHDTFAGKAFIHSVVRGRAEGRIRHTRTPILRYKLAPRVNSHVDAWSFRRSLRQWVGVRFVLTSRSALVVDEPRRLM